MISDKVFKFEILLYPCCSFPISSAYKSVGITDKTTAAGSQLDDLALVEHLITHTLRTGMAAGRNYKDIYQDCKNRLEAMRYLQCTA